MSNTTTTLPTSSPPPPPSSTPVTLPSSSPPPPPSSTPAPSTTSAAPPSSTSIPKSTTTAPTPTPSVETITSVVSPTTPPGSGSAAPPSTIIITRTQDNSANPTDGSPSSSSSAAATGAPGLQDPKGERVDGGLTTGGKTAIAVVVPVVVVALLVIAGILLWRRRKSKKTAEEARRKEVEEYGFNPNNDPTLPAVGMQSEMAEDQSGYRGWGNTTSSNRKASTTLTSGMTYSDSNSNPGGYGTPGSPTNANYSDTHSGEPLMNTRRQTMDSDGVGALGGAPVAAQNQNGVRRGPSNASSSYSAAERSDNSGEYPLPSHNPQEYYQDNNQGYYHASPYDPNTYGAPQQQPIIRDVSARRNTRIENPSVFPQQGNSGIAQNF